MAKKNKTQNPVKKGPGMVGGEMSRLEKIGSTLKNVFGGTVTTVGSAGGAAMKGVAVGGATKLVLDAGVEAIGEKTDTVTYKRKKGPFGLFTETKKMTRGEFEDKILDDPKESRRVKDAKVSGTIHDNKKTIGRATTATGFVTGGCTAAVNMRNEIATAKRNKQYITNQQVLNAQARRTAASAEKVESANADN